MSLVSGFHHITVCASGAQEDVDFLTQVFGQRLIKQTILFDGRYAHYHLYYSNADCQPAGVGADSVHGILGAKGIAEVLEGASGSPQDSARRHSGAVWAGLH